jgi:hypothetical protein
MAGLQYGACWVVSVKMSPVIGESGEFRGVGAPPPTCTWFASAGIKATACFPLRYVFLRSNVLSLSVFLSLYALFLATYS